MNQDRGFIIHTKTAMDFLHSYKVTDEIMLTTSGDILDSFGTPLSPKHFIVCLGCATWQSSQLEQEIGQNFWLVSEASHHILFETGYLDRWNEANELLGISGVLAPSARA